MCLAFARTGSGVAIVLHHTIIRSRNRQRSAAFAADLLRTRGQRRSAPFVPVQVNRHLTFDFDDRFEVDMGHYAFRVDGATFGAMLSRIVGSDIEYGSGPGRWMDREINHLGGGQGSTSASGRPQLRALHAVDLRPKDCCSTATRPTGLTRAPAADAGVGGPGV
jgi:hypothetical protein